MRRLTLLPKHRKYSAHFIKPINSWKIIPNTRYFQHDKEKSSDLLRGNGNGAIARNFLHPFVVLILAKLLEGLRFLTFLPAAIAPYHISQEVNHCIIIAVVFLHPYIYFMDTTTAMYTLCMYIRGRFILVKFKSIKPSDL